jgi:hypothetical protein
VLDTRSNQSPGRATRETVCAEARNSPPQGGGQPFPEPLILCRKTRHQPHQPPISSEMPVGMVAEVPLAGQSFGRTILHAADAVEEVLGAGSGHGAGRWRGDGWGVDVFMVPAGEKPLSDLLDLVARVAGP